MIINGPNQKAHHMGQHLNPHTWWLLLPSNMISWVCRVLCLVGLGVKSARRPPKINSQGLFIRNWQCPKNCAYYSRLSFRIEKERLSLKAGSCWIFHQAPFELWLCDCWYAFGGIELKCIPKLDLKWCSTKEQDASNQNNMYQETTEIG